MLNELTVEITVRESRPLSLVRTASASTRVEGRLVRECKPGLCTGENKHAGDKCQLTTVAT